MSPEHWPGDAGDLIASDPYGQFLSRLEDAINAAIVHVSRTLSTACGLPEIELPTISMSWEDICLILDL